jgi:hypothetical protein
MVGCCVCRCSRVLAAVLFSFRRLIPFLTGGSRAGERRLEQKQFSLCLSTASPASVLNPAALLERAKWLTAQDVEWKAKITLMKASDEWVLITGAPGVGKTYHMQSEYLAKAQAGKVDHLGRRVVHLDASSDLFTLVAMASWLESTIDTTEPVLLIVDLFHMLPPELKEQLLQWVGPRRYIKLVMIASRHDLADLVLFAKHLQHNRTLSQKSVEATRSNIIHCRGSVDEIIDVKVVPKICEVLGGGADLRTWFQRPMSDLRPHASRIPSTLLFTRLWLQSTSMLIGDDMLSMRDVEKSPMLSALQHPREDQCYRDDVAVGRSLMSYLTRQMWHLKSFSESFVKAIVFVYSLDAVMTPLRRKWEELTAADLTEVLEGGARRPLSVASGLQQFLA